MIGLSTTWWSITCWILLTSWRCRSIRRRPGSIRSTRGIGSRGRRGFRENDCLFVMANKMIIQQLTTLILYIFSQSCPFLCPFGRVEIKSFPVFNRANITFLRLINSNKNSNVAQRQQPLHPKTSKAKPLAPQALPKLPNQTPQPHPHLTLAIPQVLLLPKPLLLRQDQPDGSREERKG